MSRKRSISAILSVTFAPPSTTVSGRSGSSISASSVVTSRSSSGPAADGQALGHADGRGVGAVHGAERVEHERVGEVGEVAARAAGSFFVSPGSQRVFSSTSTSPRSQPRRRRGEPPAPRPPAPGARVAPSSSPSRFDTGAIDVRRVVALRPAEVRAHHDLRTALAQLLDRGQSGADARVVGHLAALERHVQVRAHEHRRPAPRPGPQDVFLRSSSEPRQARRFYRTRCARSTTRFE